MTCVVGVTEGAKVWMGADSAASDAETSDLTIRRDPKVFAIGAFTVGFCDSFRQGQLVAMEFSPPKHPRGVSVDRYMATLFVHALRKLLSDGGVVARKDSREEAAGALLVGYRGRLFEVADDFHVGESVHPFHAIGSGAQAALGALYASKGLAPKARLSQALHAAQAFTTTVRAPFIIMEPKS